MSQTGKSIRLNRIFRSASKRALIVAYDHALMLGPIPGTEDPAPYLRRFAACGVDGVLVSLGTLRNCVDAFLAPQPPAVIARLDWTNVWHRAGAAQTGDYRSTLVGSVEDAVCDGADAVVTYLFVGSGDAAADAQEIAKNAEVNRECQRLGVVHIMESMARGKDVADCADPAWIRFHTRVASELGADLIKTDYPREAAALGEIVSACPTPILLAGGPRSGGDDQALAMVRGVVAAGAAGLIFGRNVFQSEDMEAFLGRAKEILAGGPPSPTRQSAH
jgi:DhnA family fructose-bisphosphate aldolase class Ia